MTHRVLCKVAEGKGSPVVPAGVYEGVEEVVGVQLLQARAVLKHRQHTLLRHLQQGEVRVPTVTGPLVFSPGRAGRCCCCNAGLYTRPTPVRNLMLFRGRSQKSRTDVIL